MKKLLLLSLLLIPNLCRAGTYDVQYYKSIIDTTTLRNDRHLRGSYYIGTSSATNDANIYLGYDGRIKSQFAGTYVAPTGLVEISTGTNSYSLWVDSDSIAVGIGTKTPTAGVELEVNGDIKSDTFTVTGDVKISATKKLYFDGGGNTYATETSSDLLDFIVGGTNIFSASPTDVTFGQGWTSSDNCVLTLTKYLYTDVATNTGIYSPSTKQIDFKINNVTNFDIRETQIVASVKLTPAGAGSISTGDATNYWNDISYKTLTDRGCLGWFDDGVELQDGRIVSDTEALLAIKKHPTKKTIYGVDMLDYKTFPKVAYKKAEVDGVILDRDSDNEPINGADGIEMTSMFSIMIGAIKELTLENREQNKKIAHLEKRIEKLENRNYK